MLPLAKRSVHLDRELITADSATSAKPLIADGIAVPRKSTVQGQEEAHAPQQTPVSFEYWILSGIDLPELTTSGISAATIIACNTSNHRKPIDSHGKAATTMRATISAKMYGQILQIASSGEILPMAHAP